MRAELSDARRSILHRQERDALAVLAQIKNEAASPLAVQAQDNLVLRTDLLELALLKQARDIAGIREGLRFHAERVDRIAGTTSDGQTTDVLNGPRHAENLNARLDAIESWRLRFIPTAAS